MRLAMQALQDDRVAIFHFFDTMHDTCRQPTVGKSKCKLPEHGRIVGSFRSVKNFKTDDATFGIVVHHDAVRDFSTVLDRTIG